MQEEEMKNCEKNCIMRIASLALGGGKVLFANKNGEYGGNGEYGQRVIHGWPRKE